MGCTTPPGDPRAGPTVGPAPTPTGTPAPSVLRVAASDPGSLDPRDLDSHDDLLLASQLFDGLVAYRPGDAAVVPAAARSWEVEDGGRRFVFHLRPGASFHDGTPVRSRDFVAAWSRLADPLAAAPFGFLLERVQGYQRFQRRATEPTLAGLRAPNDRTLEVRLSQPWPDFVSVLGHPALSPVPAGTRGPDADLRPIGNGPYRLVGELLPGEPIVMERFEGYAGTSSELDRLEFRVFEDPDEAWPEFLAGELDVAPIPAAVLPEARSRFGDAGVVTLARLLYCGFNQLDPRLRWRRLGLAASLAADRGAIAAEVYGGLAEPATGIVPPTLPGYREDACQGACTRDEERAARLVEALPRRSRSFALDYARSDVGEALAEALRTQLEGVGLQVRPRPHPEREYRALLQREREEFFCLTWIADYPRQQALLEPLFLSTSPDNHTGVSDAALDRMLIRAREEPSAAARQELYAEAEEAALRRMPLVPLVWFRSHLAARPDVEGFAVDPLGLFDAARLRLAG
ncbi:MAG TPA: ABC transporter substrate-binding protein [Actinomycetota bacterium]|nr:ABC transporter substrate-binding protein [Actinomycetota bacterium]